MSNQCNDTICHFSWNQINPLTPGTFCKKCIFLDILVIFRLYHGQITFNPVENAFATQQLAFLATSIAWSLMVLNSNKTKLDGEVWWNTFQSWWNFLHLFTLRESLICNRSWTVKISSSNTKSTLLRLMSSSYEKIQDHLESSRN